MLELFQKLLPMPLTAVFRLDIPAIDVSVAPGALMVERPLDKPNTPAGRVEQKKSDFVFILQQVLISLKWWG